MENLFEILVDRLRKGIVSFVVRCQTKVQDTDCYNQQNTGQQR